MKDMMLNPVKQWLKWFLVCVIPMTCAAVGADITYWLDNPQNWPADIRSQIEFSVQEAVSLYNQHGSFNKHITVQYNPGVPTADGNINGNIRLGGSRNTRVMLHEMAHTLGVGTHWNWHVNGPITTAWIQEFNGPGAFLSGDGMHFWPYGLNYDSEDGFINRIRHIKIVSALACDMGYLGIVREPVSQTAPAGGVAVLSVQAANAQGYQWYKQGQAGPLTNGAKISGATGPTLQISNAAISDEGLYYCVISSGSGTLSSRKARLTIERFLGQWGFDGNANDVLGSYHGAVVGSVGYPAGVIGQAIDLDGFEDYVNLPTEVTGAAFTVAMWVNWDGGDPWQRIFDFGTGTSQYMFLTPRSGWNTLRFGIKSGVNFQSDEQIIETAQLPVGQWVHLAVTLSGNTAVLYVNGRAAASNTNVTNRPYDFTATSTYIGRSQFDADPLFNGRIDDFRIYSYALSAADINRIAFERSGLTPWNGEPVAIPGKVEAEHFDLGGPGVAYYDTTVGNAGSSFRSYENVDIFSITDAGADYAIGNISNGEWLIYTVNSTADETDIFARVASSQDGGQIRVWLDGNFLATIDVPNTGALTTWQTVSATCLPLSTLQDAALKLEFVGTGFRVNWVRFGRRMPYSGTPAVLPGRLEFENFDQGGQHISYLDNTAVNGYGQYRPLDAVDIMSINDGGPGFAVFATGAPSQEWLDYTCTIQGGVYALVVRSSSPYSAQPWLLLLDGQTIASFSLPTTGGWSSWQDTVIEGVELPGGEHTLRFKITQSSGLVNSVEFLHQYYFADINRDGFVDTKDLMVLAGQWMGLPGTPSADIAPFGGDGVVNLTDLQALAESWMLND